MYLNVANVNSLCDLHVHTWDCFGYVGEHPHFHLCMAVASNGKDQGC